MADSSSRILFSKMYLTVHCLIQPSLDTEELSGSSSETSETFQLNGSCSANDHTLENCTFSSLRRCCVCDKYLWGIVRQGYRCLGELMLALFHRCNCSDSVYRASEIEKFWSRINPLETFMGPSLTHDNVKISEWNKSWERRVVGGIRVVCDEAVLSWILLYTR